MSEELRRLIVDICETDPRKANDAIVTAALLLEWDNQGFLDRTSAELFSYAGLFLSAPSPQDVDEILRCLDGFLSNATADNSMRNSVIWALTRSTRVEVVPILTRLLTRGNDTRELCEGTDALLTFAAIIKVQGVPQTAALDELRQKLSVLRFEDPETEAARRQVLNIPRSP